MSFVVVCLFVCFSFFFFYVGQVAVLLVNPTFRIRYGVVIITGAVF